MTLVLLLMACHKHGEALQTWPGPDGLSCGNQRVLTVDPVDWAQVASVAVRLDENSPAAVARPRQTIAVLHPDDLAKGYQLSLQGEAGPASCRITPSNPDAELLECGPYTFTVHYDPLCTFAPEVEGLERKARPETANFVLAQKFGDRFDTPDVRDAWNTLDGRGLAAEANECAARNDPYDSRCRLMIDIRNQMDRGLARLDALDRFEDPRDARDVEATGAGLDWCDADTTPQGLVCKEPHPLRDLLLDDRLLVDTTERCTSDTRSFFEIEMAHVQDRPADADGKRHQTCGGRTPGDDVIDTLLTITINGPDRLPPGAPFYGPTDAEADPLRGDGVDAPSEPASANFPWLRAPRSQK